MLKIQARAAGHCGIRGTKLHCVTACAPIGETKSLRPLKRCAQGLSRTGVIGRELLGALVFVIRLQTQLQLPCSFHATAVAVVKTVKT